MTLDLAYLDHLAEDLRGGNAEEVGFVVSEITLHDGSVIRPPSSGVTVVVGSNNVGKSTLLRDMMRTLQRHPNQPVQPSVLIDRLTLVPSGSPADVTTWLAEHLRFGFRGQSNGFFRQGAVIPVDVARAYWRQDLDCLGQLFPVFVYWADAATRLGNVGGVNRRNRIEEAPLAPLHYLEEDKDSLQLVDELSRQVFQLPLYLDRISGQLHLRVGAIPGAAPEIDDVSDDYVRRVGSLPTLDEQGDGMRSFFGLLLPLLTTRYMFVGVDEPEAFLHPPQAVSLGAALARLAWDVGAQVVVATHSRSFLLGVLSVHDANVSVVRLGRQDDETSAHQLDPTAIRELWADPVLKYGNVLDGLFHRMAVICEADADCRFYSAAIQELPPSSKTVNPDDVLFIPSGGKQGMAKLATILQSIAIPFAVSPDLDILDNEKTLRGLVEAMGGDWSALQPDYRLATQPFSSRSSKWSEIKRFGDAAFKGQAGVAFARLIKKLDALGVICVRKGEMENFSQGLGVAKGPAWLPAALNARIHRQREVREHVRRLLRRL